MRRPPAFTVALLLALAIVATWWQLSERRARALAAGIEVAEARVRALEDSLRAGALVPPDRSSAAGASTVSPEWLARLRARGLSDPARQIPASLADHPEVIAEPGVLGGTMGFHDERAIRLLDGPWVLAPFDEGHIEGRGVFEYSVSPGGRIAWKRLATRLDE